MSYAQIISAFDLLTSEQRVELVHELWERVPIDQWPLPTESVITVAERRSDMIDEGKMSVEDWETARQRARDSAGLNG